MAWAISGVSHGAGGRLGRKRVVAGAWVSSRLRRVVSKCLARLCDFADRRLEASDEKVERLMDLRLRRVTVCLVRAGGEMSSKQRIAEWSDGRAEVVLVERTKQLREAGLM